MEDLYLSKSSVELYLQCGFRYEMKYIKKALGLQKREDTEASVFGNLIHDILEEKFSTRKGDDVLEMFREKFTKSSLLSQKFFDLGEFLLRDYVSVSTPTTKVIGLEIPFQLFLDNGVPVKGFIDRIDEIDKDTLLIIDYKTGYSQPLTPDGLQSDIQVGIYNLAAKILYPQYKNIIVSLNYLHFGKVSTQRSEENLERLKGYLKSIYEKVLISIETGKDLEPRINSYCGYCEYKSKCPLYKEVVEKEGNDIATFNGMIIPESGLTVDIEKIDVFHKFIKGKIKILEDIEEKVKGFIGGHIKTNGSGGRVTLGKTNYVLSGKKYTNYKVSDVIEIAKSKDLNLEDLLSVQKGNVDSALKDDRESLRLLKEGASVAYGREFVQEKK